MTSPFGRAGVPAMSQTPAITSPCVVCLSGCTLLFIDDPPLYYLSFSIASRIIAADAACLSRVARSSPILA